MSSGAAHWGRAGYANVTRALVGLSLAALAACAAPSPVQPPVPGTEPTATGQPSPPYPAATVAASPTPAPTAPPATLVPPPAEFTVGLPAAPSNLDPATATGSAELLITRHIYEGLTAYAAGGTTVVPALAERWETSADGLTWTFTLREGVAFSDGTPLTAEAARQNFDRWLAGTPPGDYAVWRAMFGGFAGEAGPDGEPLSLVAGVEAPRANELVLALNRPDASLPGTLAMPSFALVSPKALAQPDPPSSLSQVSAGTGPFLLAPTRAPGLIRLERNPAYWGPAAQPDALVFKDIPDAAQRLRALEAGEIEVALGLPPEVVASAGPRANVVHNPALATAYLGFNLAQPPWQSLDCRLAVARSLDRAGYVERFFGSEAEVAETLLPPAVWALDPPAASLAADPVAAASNLRACLAANPALPAVRFYVPPVARPYLPDPAGLAGAIQANLAELPLSVEVASPAWPTEWLGEVYSGQAGLFLLGATGANGDPDAYLCPLFCGLEGAFNSDGRGNPLPPDDEVAALLQAARTTADPAQRAELYERAQMLVAAKVLVVPLAHPRPALAFAPGITGYTPSPIDTVFFGLKYSE